MIDILSFLGMKVRPVQIYLKISALGIPLQEQTKEPLRFAI